MTQGILDRIDAVIEDHYLSQAMGSVRDLLDGEHGSWPCRWSPARVNLFPTSEAPPFATQALAGATRDLVPFLEAIASWARATEAHLRATRPTD